MITVTFNGIELTKYFKIMDIDRDLLPARQNYSVDSEFRHGADFDGYKYNNRIIKVKAVLLTDDTEKLQIIKRELAGVLDVEEPAQLIFSDEPDKYYLAVLDGTTAIDQFLGNGTVELDFICHDPFAYAVEETVVENIPGSTEIEVINDGTHVAYPVLEVEMNSQNSLVAFINERGKILQFGDPDLVDTAIVQQAESLINVKKFTHEVVDAGDWKVNSEEFTNVLSDGQKLAVTMPLVFTNDGAGIQKNTRGEGKVYNGACISRMLPADSNGHTGAANFTANMSIRYETHTISDTGISRLEFRDKMDKHVYGITFYKNATTNNNARAYITVNNSVVYNHTFQPTAWNPLTSAGKGIVLNKFGGEFTATVGNVSEGGFQHSFNLDLLRDTEVVKIVHYTASWATTENRMTNAISSFSFTKHDVDKIVAAPTIFVPSDIVTADTSKGLFMINNVESMNLDTLGNQWEDFYLEKGSNKITTVHSDFSDIPKTRIRYRKRWL